MPPAALFVHAPAGPPGPGGARLRSRIKVAAERCLAARPLLRLSLARSRGDTLVLAYHNVVPRGEASCGDRSLHLPQEAFAAQLDALCATHEVVPLAEVLQPPAAGSRRPRAVVTFDDAYRGAVEAGVAELAARGLPATVFVAPGRLGRDCWWDLLSPGAGGLPPAVRDAALWTHRGEDAAVRRWAAAVAMTPGRVARHATIADEGELRAALRHPGITLGSHSWSHANLAALLPAEVEAELTRPLRWLRERFDAVVPWLSYPYGLTSPAVSAAAAAAGYRGAVLTDGGWVRGGAPQPYAVPRVNIPSGLSRHGFSLRAAGLL